MIKDWNDLAELENIKLNQDIKTGNNLLLLDGNNIAFRFLHRANYNNFSQEYIRTVTSLAKSYSCVRSVVCFDYGKSYFRKNLHEEYKISRKEPEKEEEKQHYREFFECLNELVSLLVDEGIENYKFQGVEADDVIAYFVNNISPYYDHTWIISSDRDLFQLLSPQVSIFNLFSRKEITPDYLLSNTGCSPSEYLLARILMGDKSDDIKGVEGIGEKRAASLAIKYKTLQYLLDSFPITGKSQYIQNLNNSRELLLHNEKLINLKNYHEQAILAGKESPANFDILEKIKEETHARKN